MEAPGTTPRSVHPNLARLDAAYDRIVERYARGELNAEAANAAVAALVARDDEGVLWSKDPSTGGWLRRTIDGRVVPGVPPCYGYLTPSGHDLNPHPDVFRPDERLSYHPIDETMLVAPGALAGSTRLLPARPAGRAGRQRLAAAALAFAVGAAVLLGAGLAR